MSANNQILLKKYKGKWYVFNVMAESWSKTNRLNVKEAIKSFYLKTVALKFAMNIAFDTEYGVGEVLIKDGARVKIINK